MSEALSFIGDLLPRPPKRWPVVLGLAAAYYGLPMLAPQLFEKRIKGDVAVITGAGSGIGRLMALRLVKEGCKVALLDMNEAAVSKVAEECKQLGCSEARAYKCDVTDREAVYAVARRVESDFGRADIIINNAGIVEANYLTEASDARMELTMKVNVMAIFWVTKAFLKGMLERDHGHVVIIASSAGRVGVPKMVSYCASKYGAVGAGEAIRLELEKLGSKIQCTTVCPSYCATGMFEGARIQPRYSFLEGPMNALMPLLEPEYVAGLVIDAVKQNQALLVTPRFGYMTPIVQGLLPVRLADRIMNDIGVSHSMDDFKQTRA